MSSTIEYTECPKCKFEEACYERFTNGYTLFYCKRCGYTVENGIETRKGSIEEV